MTGRRSSRPLPIEQRQGAHPRGSTLGLNLRVVHILGMRSIRQTFRRPQLMAPIVVFPTLLLAIQTGGAGSAIELPGFPPVQSFLQFMLAGAMMQSLMLAGNSGGIAMAVDIEMGFTDRLFAAPISRFAIVLGRLAGTAALGLFSALWFLAIGLVFGAEIESGVPGALIAIVFVTASTLAVGGIGAAIALRTGTASVVQGLFPLIFVVLFLSSAFFPQGLMIEPAKTIAAYNPLSFIVNGIRDPMISGISASDMLAAVVAIAGITALGLWLSARALQHRLRVGG
jgi:ABC-2 type transport system permease protein